VHKYPSLHSTNWLTVQHAAGSAVHGAATSLAAERRCGISEGSMSSFKSITETNFANYLLIRN